MLILFFILCLLNFSIAKLPHKTYLINLERRKDKFLIADFQLKMMNLEYEYVQAVDGALLKDAFTKNNTLKYNDILRIPFTFKLKEKNFVVKNNQDVKRLGCLFSHLVTLDKIVNENTTDPVLILEDDFVADGNALETMRTVLTKLPTDWGILYVGHCHPNTHNGCFNVAGHEICKAVELIPCSHAILVNGSQAAKKMFQAGNDGDDHNSDFFAQKTDLKRYIMHPYIFKQLREIKADVASPGGTWVRMKNETVADIVRAKFLDTAK